MNEQIYNRLREKIAEHSAYFPASTSGVELKFLKRLFSVEEAEIYMNLTERLETSQRIAGRAMQDHETVAATLKRMAEKGLLFPKRKGETYYYAAAPFVHGIAEHQANRLDRELAQLYEDYIWAEKVPEVPTTDQEEGEIFLPTRSIPVNTPVNISRPIAPYEDVREIIKNQDRIAVATCFCAKALNLLETGCTQPLEVCLFLGFYADYYIDLGMGRRVSQEEALDILAQAEKAGLVHQIPNTQDPGAICNCCPNCCGALRILRMLPNPAAIAISSYFSQVQPDLCNGCETCVARCPMDAITMDENGIAGINLDRCIGCGLCVNTCPTEALMLVAKSVEAIHEPAFTSRFMRSSQDIEGTISLE